MKIIYRPEVDGLRAIAVLSVILYHLQLSMNGKNIFTGGFIGVDIFFVISGYLITSIILKEIFETKNFSFLHFYERRIRRIIPVLFFIIFVSIPFAWNYLLPSNLESLSKSILSSIFFVSNVFFHESGLIYGTEKSILKPFLHTWSLSIEEQFYIFFPITVFLIFRFLKKFLLELLILTALVSFLFAQFISQDYISFNFYSLPTRIWELLAGSILSFLELKSFNKSKNRNLKSLMTFLGLILIFLSIIFFHDEMPHPSTYTLIPVLGVCLIIWFGNQEFLFSENILSSKILVNIGLISYSLYLWHYPILSFDLLGQFLFFNDNNFYSKTLYLLLIFTLSFFTYIFIEKKFRNKKTKFKKVFIFISSLFIIIVSFNLYFIIKNESFAKKFIINDKIKIDRSFYVKESRNFEFKNINLKYTDNKNKKNVLIIGNSHGEDLYKIIYYNKNLNNKYDFEMISPLEKRTSDINYQVSCLKNLILFKNTNCKIRKRPNTNWGENILKQYERSHYILLSTKWYESDLSDLDQIIKLIKKDQKIPLIFLNNLESDIDVNELNIFDNFLFINRKMPNKNELKKIKKKFFNSKKNTENINQRISKIAKENEVKVFDHLNYKCSKENKSCEVLTSDNFKIYWDYAHITKAGAIYLGKKMDKINFLDF